MTYSASSEPEPARQEVDEMSGPALLEFGASWCGHCQALQPELVEALKAHPRIRHIKIEDGKGKPLGRSFRVKLWPTLVLMRDGQVLKQLVRPGGAELREAMSLLAD